MPITIRKITSEIAKALFLKHHANIAYRMIIQDDYSVIIGLCVEPRPDGEFSVHTFIQPLFIPFPALLYSLGERIGYWEREDLQIVIPVIQKYIEKLPHYDSISTIINMINSHALIYRGSEIRRYEFLAYSYIVINQYENAMEYLKKIIALEDNIDADWFKDAVMRAKKLLYLIEHDRAIEIRDLLLNWQKETMTALKLPDNSD